MLISLTLDLLPPEILELIASVLPAKSLLNYIQSCKNIFEVITNTEIFWKAKFRSEFEPFYFLWKETGQESIAPAFPEDENNTFRGLFHRLYQSHSLEQSSIIANWKKKASIPWKHDQTLKACAQLSMFLIRLKALFSDNECWMKSLITGFQNSKFDTKYQIDFLLSPVSADSHDSRWSTPEVEALIRKNTSRIVPFLEDFSPDDQCFDFVYFWQRSDEECFEFSFDSAKIVYYWMYDGSFSIPMALNFRDFLRFYLSGIIFYEDWHNTDEFRYPFKLEHVRDFSGEFRQYSNNDLKKESISVQYMARFSELVKLPTSSDTYLCPIAELSDALELMDFEVRTIKVIFRIFIQSLSLPLDL